MSAVTSLPCADAPAMLSDALLEHFDKPGPRYTSYPTADRFTERFGAADCLRALSQRANEAAAPLSVYVHIPFCESVCYYCACNKIITRHHERAAPYLDALEAEIELVLAALGPNRPASQLHFGGGSPTFLSDAELERVLRTLRRAFSFDAAAEMSIEVDPRTVTPARLAHLRAIGFNRISFGVQDFDPQVQKAVHREQSFESVRDLMASARELGFDSINADLIYGLPRQTPSSFARTVAQINALCPDRIALYAYAHLPARFKPQRRIAVDELPSAGERVAMQRGAMQAFAACGYTYIGMDHFAQPDDALAIAKREGRLHRNFQGYSTQSDCDLIGLGVSAIGRVGATYYQNAKTLPEYHEALREGRLPVVRGLALSRDDEIRRAVIGALMCQGRLDFEAIEAGFQIEFRSYFSRELERMGALVDAGLVELDSGAIQVTAAGWSVVRAVAMVFDHYLQDVRSGERLRERFSRIL